MSQLLNQQVGSWWQVPILAAAVWMWNKSPGLLVQPGSFVIYNPMAILCSIVQCEEHAPKSLCRNKFWPREFRGKFSSISDNWHCIPTCMLDFPHPARHMAKNCHRGWPVGMPVSQHRGLDSHSDSTISRLRSTRHNYFLKLQERLSSQTKGHRSWSWEP